MVNMIRQMVVETHYGSPGVRGAFPFLKCVSFEASFVIKTAQLITMARIVDDTLGGSGRIIPERTQWMFLDLVKSRPLPCR